MQSWSYLQCERYQMMLFSTSSILGQIGNIRTKYTIKIFMISTQNTNQPTVLEAPTLSQDNLVTVISKIQPYRKGGIRLQHEEINGKHLFHNYGHGSSGISLAYGSAFMSVKSIYTFLNVDHPIDCAIVGSGLIAMLTAIELVRSGHFVTIYSDKFAKYGEKDISKKVASQVDEGLWLPFGYDMTDRLRHELLSKVSYEYYRDCLKTKRYQSFKMATVYERDATVQQLKQRIPGFLYNGYKNVEVDFGNGQAEKYIKMRTIKVDVELFLEQLRVEATLRGIKFVQKKFTNKNEILSLNHECIFNCSGHTSKTLFNDNNLTQTMDHLIIFKNPSKLNYTVSANLRDNLHTRVHCFGDRVVVRSQTPANQVSSEEFVKKLVSQTRLFFENRGTRAKL